MLFTAAARGGLAQACITQIVLIRNERFDRAVARHLARCRPAAIIGYDTACLKTFQACQSVGAVRILDQVIGHIAVGAPLLEEEQRLHPEWADSIPLHQVRYTIERCLSEARQADAVLAPSDYVRDTLVQVGVQPSKILLLPYGVDVERFRPAAPKESTVFRVLFIGQLSQRKGIKYLLEAWKRLQLPNAELVIVGNLCGKGQGLIPYRGLFQHLPSVPYAELHSYYHRADVFVFPSLHEGAALTVYEAMACGLPIITTYNSGSPVRDGQEGFIVPIRDIDAIAQRIRQLYVNRSLGRQMGERARTRVEQF